MRINWLIVLFAALAVVADAQELRPPQEVRISAKPYLPVAAPLRVEADLVEVGVVVRNHEGRPIPGLKRENFVVSDQGAARELTYFAVETRGIGNPQTGAGRVSESSPAMTESAQPASGGIPAQSRVIALYFEDFGTNSSDLKRAQVAGRRFVKEGLDDSDRVALFSTSGDFLDYTNDKAKLTAAIDKLKSHPKFSEAGAGGCPRISPYQAYQISVLSDPAAMDSAVQESKQCASSDSDYTRSPTVTDQPILAQAELTWGQVRIASQVTLAAIDRAMRSLQSMPGRRLFLLVSSGFNSGTLEPERDRLINRALRAGIVINSVDAKGLYAEVPGRGPNEDINTVRALPVQTFRFEATSIGDKVFASNQVMSDLAQATGGLFFHNNNDLPNGFRQLGSIPEVRYVLGFHRGTAGAADGKYHKLKVGLVDTKPYVIQARPGYFATPAGAEVKPAVLSAREKLDREVTEGSTLTDFPALVAFRLDKTQNAAVVTVKAQIHVVIDKMQFPVREERRMQQLVLVAALLDARGNIVAAKEGTMDFALTGATYTKLSTNGITAGLNLDAPPGNYRLRTVVQEAVEGKMASSTLAIEVK